MSVFHAGCEATDVVRFSIVNYWNVAALAVMLQIVVVGQLLVLLPLHNYICSARQYIHFEVPSGTIFLFPEHERRAIAKAIETLIVVRADNNGKNS